MLELDRIRMHKERKPAITLAKAQQITRSMYQMAYALP